MNYETRIGHADGAEVYIDEQERAAIRKRRWLVAGVIIAILVLVGAYLAMKTAGGSGDEAAEKKQAPRVTVVVPGKQLVENLISTTGTLAARREMPVGVVGEGGVVTRVLVEPGSWVQAGQVLASVDRQVQSQQSGQLAAQINVTQADARLTQSDLERAQALASRGFISKAEIERKTALRDAAAARVRVAQAQFGENRARIGRLDVRAPASGLVLTRTVEPGQVIGAGTGVLFRIARGGEMEMKAQLGEADLARMSVGLSAKVTPAGAPQVFTGQIWQLPPVIDMQTRQGVVRIALAYDRALRPGGFASAVITSGALEAPLLPESAVQSDAKGSYAYIIDDKNVVRRRDVKVGSVTNAGVTIVGGLTGAESVVLSAGAFLNPGETVQPLRSGQQR